MDDIFMQIRARVIDSNTHWLALSLSSHLFPDFIYLFIFHIFCWEFPVIVIADYCLQCFDAVGWAAGRASGL